MSRVRWQSVLMGAAAFLAAHLVERVMWMSWFADSSIVPWFTNSGRAVAVTMSLMAVAGALSALAAHDRSERMHRAASTAGGGTVALIIALTVTGPGTIFPLAIVIGAALIIAGVFAGMFAVHSLIHSDDRR